jgi:DNA polymerase III epsilon subunit-like protein
MRFFIDFEATQPGNEIIAIGAVAENGATFHTLVKPQLSSISTYVSQLTHISPEDLEWAPDINKALIEFDAWMTAQESNIMNCRFIAYGNDDRFIKSTLPAITNSHAFTVAAILMAKLEDCYDETRKFFHGTIKLVHAFNYVQSVTTEQKHNPLEDAMMLQKVYEYTQTHEPLPVHPFNPAFEATVSSQSAKMPSGTFFCRTSAKKTAQVYNFATCDDAIDWLITEVMKAKEPERIHRDRIMAHIMKAIRTKSRYCNFLWDRVKDEEKEENNE